MLSLIKIWSVDHKNAVKYTNQADEEASTTKSLSNIFLGHPVHVSVIVLNSYNHVAF